MAVVDWLAEGEMGGAGEWLNWIALFSMVTGLSNRNFMANHFP